MAIKVTDHAIDLRLNKLAHLWAAGMISLTEEFEMLCLRKLVEQRAKKVEWEHNGDVRNGRLVFANDHHKLYIVEENNALLLMHSRKFREV